jgi:hypothetical protein
MEENVSSRNVSSHLFSNAESLAHWRIRETWKIRERGEEWKKNGRKEIRRKGEELRIYSWRNNPNHHEYQRPEPAELTEPRIWNKEDEKHLSVVPNSKVSTTTYSRDILKMSSPAAEPAEPLVWENGPRPHQEYTHVYSSTLLWEWLGDKKPGRFPISSSSSSSPSHQPPILPNRTEPNQRRMKKQENWKEKEG